jgi:hypothetical protein
MLSIFSTPELIRHLWQLKTVVFLHWCLIRAVILRYQPPNCAKVCFSTLIQQIGKNDHSPPPIEARVKVSPDLK